MAEPAVTNATPLIFLARGGYLNLLQLTGHRVFVPAPVAFEIRERGSASLRRQMLSSFTAKKLDDIAGKSSWNTAFIQRLSCRNGLGD